MFPKTPIGAVVFALLGSAIAQTTPEAADLVARLKLAATHTDRIALLKDNEFVFDFFNAKSGIAQGSAGRTVTANSGTFPAVIGNGVAMTIGLLDACGMNTPHTHPRATEINFAVNGTLRTGMLAENGARFVFNDLPPGSATVFPKGAIHFEQNNGCEPAYFVAAFNDVDPGVDAVAQRFFGLPPDVVGAALGGIGVQQVAGLESIIPNNVAFGTDECLKRCGLTRPPVQLISQRQPRVSANALPSGFTGPTPPAPPATGTLPTPTGTRAAGATPTRAALGEIGNSSESHNSSLTPFLIALMAVNGLFLIGSLVGLVVFIRSRRNRTTGGGGKYMFAGAGSSARAPVMETGKGDYYDPYPSPAFKETQ